MDDTDAFFTQTIVGPPLSVLLGNQLAPQRLADQGLDVHLASGQAQLSVRWQEWVLLGHGSSDTGRPRRRPGVWRRRLERHALWIAIVGILCLLFSALIWGASLGGLHIGT
ncbi:MAG: hypothetical protein AB7S86_08425 [Hydrogenophaga sp.]|uniref:hypothetical protein n=1 Tax=Hydrogenophaga sp. TaxID=1904254 RepID=UPI003D0CCB48